MAEARDIVTDALREIGVLAAGEVATADEANNGLVVLNRMLDTWAAERLMIYTVTRTTWAIVASDGQYSVGSGGDVNVARPVHANDITVNYMDSTPDPDAEYPLRPLTDAGYAALDPKGQTDTLPQLFYYNPTYPLGTLTLWPAPTSTTLTGVLYAPAAVSQFAALDTAVSLPPGYEEALVKNLALRLAPSYGRPPDQMLVDYAREVKGIVKRANRRLVDMSFDAAVLFHGEGGYDIQRGSSLTGSSEAATRAGRSRLTRRGLSTGIRRCCSLRALRLSGFSTRPQALR